ncbi:MAG: LysM peptidoglycan-binding domain-containing protein [Candidatus Gastranaerophilaceae bacterium]
MKSSTIRRSTLSRESIEVIENLSKEQNSEDCIGEYVRPEETVQVEDTQNSKTQEIDLLWQNFKPAQFNTNSPFAYILIGFCVGFLVSAFLGLSISAYCIKTGKIPSGVVKAVYSMSQSQDTLEQQAQEAQNDIENRISVPTEDDTEQAVNQAQDNSETEPTFDTSKMKKYIVKSGDTGESIIKHYYGSYSPEKAELIMKANNLKTLDRINIDQELLIPVE